MKTRLSIDISGGISQGDRVHIFSPDMIPDRSKSKTATIPIGGKESESRVAILYYIKSIGLTTTRLQATEGNRKKSVTSAQEKKAVKKSVSECPQMLDLVMISNQLL